MKTYAEFWPYYVAEHRSRRNRNLHFLGTSLVFLCLIFALIHGAAWILLAPITGYGFAWAGHLFLEKNRPATFRHPLWSLRGDFHMFFLLCLGRMDSEMRRLGVDSRP